MALRASLRRVSPFGLSLALAAGCFSFGAHRAQAGELSDLKADQAKAVAGAKGKASITLSGKNGWHLNEEAPISLKLAPAAGVTLEKDKLSRKDLALASKEQARFDVPFTAKDAGKTSIEAECSFVICQASACKPVKEKVVVAVEVAPAKK